MARIVIADDDPLNRSLLREILGEAGHAVVGEATDGLEVPALVRSERPHLVVLDRVMPVHDGLATLRDLRVINRSLPVIICSTPEREHVAATMRLGANGFVAKPFERTAVLMEVERVLGIASRPVAPAATPSDAPRAAVQQADRPAEHGEERRQFARLGEALRVLVTLEGQDDVHTFTVNISASGMLLATDALSTGEHVGFRVRLEPGAPPIEGTGHVVRVDKRGRAGVAFDDLSPADHRRLVEHLRLATQAPLTST